MKKSEKTSPKDTTKKVEKEIQKQETVKDAKTKETKKVTDAKDKVTTSKKEEVKVKKETKEPKDKTADSKAKKVTKTKSKDKKDKPNLWERIVGFFKGVVKETKRVRWPDRKTMVKYSIATIIFIVFFALFFYAIDLIIALVKMVIK